MAAAGAVPQAMSGVFNTAGKFYNFVGKVSTLGGLLFGPFVLASAGAMAMATTGVPTNLDILTSFHKGLFTGVNGETGITPVLEKMGSGAKALATSFFNVAGAGISPGPEGALASMKAALDSPLVPG